ncbi:MAG: ABC transporter permease [Pseudomonadota bacterium]|nr:ABC transporter permease [Pseudomonadota bacterium]
MPVTASSPGRRTQRAAHLLAWFGTPWALAWPLAKRDILARYRGSVAGVAWALLTPLLMVGVYTLVFRGVFQARWGVVAGGPGVDGFGYVARLFAGLTVFTAVAEVATRATRLIQDNANLVKRVVFPLELLCVALLMQVALHMLLQVAVLGGLIVVVGEGLRWSWLWLFAAFAWTLLLQYTLALWLAALGCYLRDLQHLVPLAITGLMFLSPVFYPVASAPVALKVVLKINPLTAPIELFRSAWFGDPFDVQLGLLQGAVLLLLFFGGRWAFKRLRPGFADLV